MSRFFYTDPLAAGWMAKHHGFVIEGLEYSGGDHWVDMYFTEKLYVHPDSLHLLGPQPKDILFYGYGVYPHAGEAWDEVKAVIQPNDEGYPTLGDGDPMMLLDGGDFRSVRRLNRIIQRNGIAFHWPESEAA